MTDERLAQIRELAEKAIREPLEQSVTLDDEVVVAEAVAPFRNFAVEVEDARNHWTVEQRRYTFKLFAEARTAISSLLTLLDEQKKRIAQLTEENALNYELRCKHFAALSTERERVIQECARAMCDGCRLNVPFDDDPVRIANGRILHASASGTLYECQASPIRALSSLPTPPLQTQTCGRNAEPPNLDNCVIHIHLHKADQKDAEVLGESHYVAHCLELDLVATDQNPWLAVEKIGLLINRQIEFGVRNHNEANIWFPAPKSFFDELPCAQPLPTPPEEAKA